MSLTATQETSELQERDAAACGRAFVDGPETRRRPTHVRLVRARELTPQDINAWSHIQRTNTLFDNPFFRPEFVQGVARLRDDVEVAVLECEGQVIGFFPFHRIRGHVAWPAGLSLSDFHGVVIAPDATFDPRQLLDSCGLRAWHFNHALAAQHEFAPYASTAADSTYMDLSAGFEHWDKERRRVSSEFISRLYRKMRKINREVGPLRLVPVTTDDGVLQRLIAAKFEQYRRIRCTNHLAEPWRIEFLRSIAHTREAEFAGMLSVLLAGDQEIAIHLGILSGGVLHSWFQTYAQEFSKFSPGLMLHIVLAQEASTLGIRRIDFGRGPEEWKQHFKTGAVPLAEGSVDLRPLAGRLRRATTHLRELVRASAFRRPAQSIVRSIRRWTVYR